MGILLQECCGIMERSKARVASLGGLRVECGSLQPFSDDFGMGPVG